MESIEEEHATSIISHSDEDHQCDDHQKFKKRLTCECRIVLLLYTKKKLKLFFL